jgi:hypothetical protein
MIISANARLAAPTLAGANKPVAPKPLSAGRFGMVRITAFCGPNQRASAACGMPAATEINKGCDSARCGANPKATARMSCGLTASITTSAPLTALALSAAVLMP